MSQAFDVLVNRKMDKLKIQLKEEQKRDLLLNDIRWMNDLQLLLSEEDKHLGFFEIIEYCKYLDGKKNSIVNFIPAHLKKQNLC